MEKKANERAKIEQTKISNKKSLKQVDFNINLKGCKKKGIKTNHMISQVIRKRKNDTNETKNMNS